AASAQQDEEIAMAGAAVLASPATSAQPVLYFDHASVDAAFAKGAALFDGSGGRNFMVHASRRDQAGMAEVHTLDTDVIHVLDGSATLVTGGTVADQHEVEPNELRGSSITGGQTRRISRGDVIIVPNGVP